MFSSAKNACLGCGFYFLVSVTLEAILRTLFIPVIRTRGSIKAQ